MKRTILALLLCTILAGCNNSSTPSSPGTAAPATPCPNAPSGVFTVNSGETIRLSFSTTPTTTDVLITTVGAPQGAQGAGTLSWTLYNGSTILGTQQGSTTSFWKSSSSVYTGTATLVDFTAIVNGTIAGRAELTVTSGSATFDLSQARIALTQGAGGAGLTVLSDPPVMLALISASCR